MAINSALQVAARLMALVTAFLDNLEPSVATKEEFDASKMEFELARHLIQARIQSGLSQEQLAAKMGTSQSTIARLESGSSMPSMRTLTKFARATNSQLQILFKPLGRGKARAA